MFGPLAFEVYLWAVWEDTHAYLYTHIHVLSKLRVSAFSLLVAHKAAALKWHRDVRAFIADSEQIQGP